MHKHFLYTAFLAIIVTLIVNGLIFILSSKHEVPSSIKEIIKVESDGTITQVISEQEKEIDSIKSKIFLMEGKGTIVEAKLTSLQNNQDKMEESLLDSQRDLDKKIVGLDEKFTTKNKELDETVNELSKFSAATASDLDNTKKDVATNKECIANLITVLEIQKQALSETKNKVNRITRMFYNYDQVQATLDKEETK